MQTTAKVVPLASTRLPCTMPGTALVSIKRAGADWILTYAAADIAARIG